MDKENDVISMDFPEYEEEYPPFPDVKVVISDMNEAYERNIRIYEEEQRLLREEEERRIAKAAREKSAEEAANEQYIINSGIRAEVKYASDNSNTGRAADKFLTWLSGKFGRLVPAAVIGITAAVLTTALSGGTLKSRDYYAVETSPAAETVHAVSETVPTATKRVLYPFEEEDGAVVYNTSDLCFKITLMEKTDDEFVFKVKMQNLSDNVYMIFEKDFYISDGSSKSYCATTANSRCVLFQYDKTDMVLSFKPEDGFDCKSLGYFVAFDHPYYFETSVEEIVGGEHNG